MSYWDLLPLEIQEYIIQIRDRSSLMDELKDKLKIHRENRTAIRMFFSKNIKVTSWIQINIDENNKVYEPKHLFNWNDIIIDRKYRPYNNSLYILFRYKKIHYYVGSIIIPDISK